MNGIMQQIEVHCKEIQINFQVNLNTTFCVPNLIFISGKKLNA